MSAVARHGDFIIDDAVRSGGFSVEMVVHVAAEAQRGTLDRSSKEGIVGAGDGKGSDGARVGGSGSSFIVATERSSQATWG